MATTRSSGYVVTAAVWNAVLNKLTDDGNTYSGAFNGSSVIGTTGSFSSTLGVTGATTLTGHLRANGNVGIFTDANVARLNIAIGGATADNADYGRGIQITGPATNFGQMIGLVRAGARVWSLGYAYNSSVLAIGTGVNTDSNFTEAAAALTIQTTGEVQAPLQPGFLARNSANDTGVTSGSTIDFDTEIYDDGGHFASDTFTAPVTGRYLLSACVRCTNVTGGSIDMGARIVTSNATNGYYIGLSDGVPNGEDRIFSGSVIVDMDASDTASVQYYGTGNATIVGTGPGEGQTYFCGRLVL